MQRTCTPILDLVFSLADDAVSRRNEAPLLLVLVEMDVPISCGYGTAQEQSSNVFPGCDVCVVNTSMLPYCGAADHI